MEHADDLGQLILELNSSRPAEPASRSADTVRLEQWLRTLASQGGAICSWWRGRRQPSAWTDASRR